MKIDRSDNFYAAIFLGIGGCIVLTTVAGGALGGYFVSSVFSDNTAVKIVSATGASLCSLGVCIGGAYYGMMYVIKTEMKKISETAGKAIMHREH